MPYIDDILAADLSAPRKQRTQRRGSISVCGPKSYDLLWQRMIERSGRQNGTREMIALLHLGQRAGSHQLTCAIAQAVELGCSDPAAVRYLLTTAQQVRLKPDAIEFGALPRYERPLPTLEAYDHLLQAEVAR